MRISVELVPRSEAELLAHAKTVRRAFPEANAFNVPDLPQFALRSWDACAMLKSVLPSSIPHVRAMDIAPGEEVPLAHTIVNGGLNEVLVIRGDTPRDLSQRTYTNTSAEIIRRLKRYHPTLKVFAAFDPYRQGLRDELDAVARKLDAGADGFFTQPIFDLRLLEITAQMLEDQTVFWGLSPVVGARSRTYWETTNKVVFPKGFVASLAWNQAFAASALRMVHELQANVYFMPIRVDLEQYLSALVHEIKPSDLPVH
jgi:methylenetetrahydrofolate reductase (NADPH)